MKKLLLILLCLPMIGFGQCISGDCKNGYGTMILSANTKYVGEWKDDKEHGQGAYTLADGTVYKGLWENGKEIKQ